MPDLSQLMGPYGCLAGSLILNGVLWKFLSGRLKILETSLTTCEEKHQVASVELARLQGQFAVMMGQNKP